MRHLSVHFSSTRDFNSLYFEDAGKACLFIPSVLDSESGELLTVSVLFDAHGVEFKIGCRVVWRRMKGQRRPFLRPGTCLHFLPREQHKLERLLAFVDDGEVDFIKRAAPRVPLNTDVKIKVNSLTVANSTRDVSLTGMFLVTSHAFRIGDHLQIKLKVPGKLLPLAVACEVTRREPEGVGLSFLFASPSEQDHIRRLITKRGVPEGVEIQRVIVSAGVQDEGIVAGSVVHRETDHLIPSKLRAGISDDELAFVNSHLAGCDAVQQLDLPMPGVWTWEFSGPDRTLWVLRYHEEELPELRERRTKVMVRLPYDNAQALIHRAARVPGNKASRTMITATNGALVITLDRRTVVVEHLSDGR